MNSENIFLIICIITLIFLILDCLIHKTHKTIEKFENNDNNAKNTNNQKNNNNNNQKNNVEDISFLTDINNESITIKDFYPTQPQQTEKNKLLDFVYETDLFHQIIPKFGGGYLGIIWFDERINGIYECSSLRNKDWKLVENGIPDNLLRPVFLSYDRDKKLLGIFEEKGESFRKFHLYKKSEIDMDSPWKMIEKHKIISFIYDEDNILVGVDEEGKLYKKENHLIESQWQLMNLENDIPMRKLMYDFRDGYMLGLSTDFQIYRKKGYEWKKEKWDTYTLPKSLTNSVRDIWFDVDGKMLGLSRIGLVKKETGNHLSDFKEFKSECKNREISVYDLMYSLTGIRTFASMEDLGNNRNDVYVDGKKISEYQFKDPKLNQYLDFRMNMKKQCRKMKAMKLRDLDNSAQAESQVRNQKFINILDEQNDMITNLYDTIHDLKDRHY